MWDLIWDDRKAGHCAIFRKGPGAFGGLCCNLCLQGFGAVVDLLLVLTSLIVGQYGGVHHGGHGNGSGRMQAVES